MLEQRIAAVRARIAAACERADRDPAGVTLIGVTKTHSASVAKDALRAGLHDLGENRVQEAASKIPDVRRDATGARWHLIGRLQTNKVKAALGLFDILHVVDSERLVDAIDAHATRPVDVLIQVNIAGEVTKAGVAPDRALALVSYAARSTSARPVGLMTIAPQVDDPEDVRPVFRRLRELAGAAGLRELSMGMTEDYVVAVEEGATMVRIGRALFGAREEAR